MLVHGTMSDSRAMDALALALHARGYDCWSLDWGGHGASRLGQARQDFEQLAAHHVPPALDAVRRESGQREVFWVSHSGGGLLLYMHLARNPEQQALIRGLVTLGAQATSLPTGRMDYAQTVGLRVLTRALGFTPAGILPPGCEREPSLLLAQWARWKLLGRWLGEDGFDYMAALGGLKMPLLAVAGAADTIAPSQGCRAVYEAVGSAHKQWVCAAQEHGFGKDFGHGSLVRGESARRELDPLIFEWLRLQGF